MRSGIIFDIEECSIYEGQGLRITFFMKGCPLRCKWCHSPEGQKNTIEHLMKKDGTSIIIGKEWKSDKLASYIDRMSEIFDGGYTFSGGDPLMQADFLLETFSKLKKKHDIIIETAGYGDFNKLVELSKYCSKIHFGMKNLDVNVSKHCVGIDKFDQSSIIEQFNKKSKTKFDLIIPKIKGITDTDDYDQRLTDLCNDLHHLDEVKYIPYNEMTQAKKETYYA